MTTRKTTEQARAESAWAHVTSVSTSQKEYSSLARGLPALIQTNGLGQALAFLRAKGKGDANKPHTMIYSHLSSWVCRAIDATNPPSDLLTWIIRQNSGAYRLATNEALAYALWLRRFAEAQGWGEAEDA